MDKLNVRLDTFEGPLDLLLYLIKENKMDIYDIRISVITEQYLDSLEMMKQMDIEVASEFMVMAATLMYIKSKMLLPVETVDEDDIDVEDPRNMLVRQLVEYRIFKKASELLEEKEKDMVMTYHRDVSKEVAAYTNREYLFDFSFFELLKSFKDMMDRVEDVTVHEVIKEDFKIEDKIVSLRERFGECGSMRLKELCRKGISKLEMVVYILAVLELARMKEIKVMQSETFGEIWLYRN